MLSLYWRQGRSSRSIDQLWTAFLKPEFSRYYDGVRVFVLLILKKHVMRGKPEQGGPSCWIYLETGKQMTREM